MRDIISIVARPEGVYSSFMGKSLDSLTEQETARETAPAPDMRANPEDLRACANALMFEGPAFKARPLKAPKGHMVYIVGGETGPVKIGWTQQPIKERLKCIQSGSPVKLHVLALQPAPRVKELLYHRQFAKYRLHGEWFERSPEIVDLIERLRVAFGGPVQGGTAEHLGR